MQTINITILTRNRVKFLAETIASVVGQVVPQGYKVEIVISDNSDNDITENFVKRNFANLTYIRRIPCVEAIEHIRLRLKEINHDFFMLFHDDDVMGDNMIAELLNLFDNNTAAVGCNAYVLKDETKTTIPFCTALKGVVDLHSMKDLLSLHLSDRQFVPFPGYLYRKNAKDAVLDNSLGKHSDVLFLSNVIKKGKIKHTYDPLFHYRIHGGQDSFAADFQAKNKLIKFLAQEMGLSRKNKDILLLRLKNVYDAHRTSMKGGASISTKRLFKFIKLLIYNRQFKLSLKMLYRVLQFQTFA